MLKASLLRIISDDEGTRGLLSFGSQSVRTLELPWRDNRRQVSCIPEGSYRLVWALSPKFGMCYHFVAVPGRGNILVHPANFAGDASKGLDTQLQGCVALCTRFGKLRNTSGRMQTAGIVSRPAVASFNAWGARQPIQLEVSYFAKEST